MGIDRDRDESRPRLDDGFAALVAARGRVVIELARHRARECLARHDGRRGLAEWSSGDEVLRRQPAQGFVQRTIEFLLNLLPLKNQA